MTLDFLRKHPIARETVPIVILAMVIAGWGKWIEFDFDSKTLIYWTLLVLGLMVITDSAYTLVQSLARRVSDTDKDESEILLRTLFRTLCWSAATAFAWIVASRTYTATLGLTIGGPLEPLGDIVGIIAGTLSFFALGLFGHSVPALLDRWQMAGRLDAGASRRFIRYGAGWCLFVLICAGGFGSVAENHLRLFSDGLINITGLLLFALVTLAAYAIPRSLLSGGRENRGNLWVILSGRDEGGLKLRRVAFEVAQHWKLGPVNLMMPASMAKPGRHALLAESAKRLKAIFPSNKWDIGEWTRTLPPAEGWDGIPQRELYPQPHLMLEALQQYRSSGDSVILATDDETTVHEWRNAVRPDLLYVAWCGKEPPSPEVDKTTFGWHAIPVARSAAERRACANLIDAIKTRRLATNQPSAPTAHMKAPSTTDPSTPSIPRLLQCPLGNFETSGIETAPSSPVSHADRADAGSSQSETISDSHQISDRAGDKARRPWLLLFMLPILCASYTFGAVGFNFSHCIIPVAAWMASRYGDAGFRVLATGLLPLWLGSPVLNGFSISHSPGLYVAALIVYWCIADADRFWHRVANCDSAFPLLIGLFVLGGIAVAVRIDPGFDLGWGGHPALLAVGIFIIGLSGRLIWSALATAVTATIISSVIFIYHRGPWRLDDFGDGDFYFASYELISHWTLGALLLLLWLGKRLGECLRGLKPTSLLSARGHIVLIILWVVLLSGWGLHLIAEVFSLFEYVDFADLIPVGHANLFMALAFSSGIYWYRYGIAATLLGSIAGIAYLALGRHLEFFEHTFDFGLYVASLAFYMMGRKLASTLGIAPGRNEMRPVSEESPDSEDSLPNRARAHSFTRMLVAWVLVPVIPLLSYTHYLSKYFSIGFDSLIVPFALWFCGRFGRSGLYAFATGGLVFLIGLQVPAGRFNFLPEFYVLGLAVGWAILNADRAAKLLLDLRFSTTGLVLITGLLPITLTFQIGDLRVGTPTQGIYLLGFLLLGWSGVSFWRAVGLIAAFKLSGNAIIMFLFDNNMGFISFYHGSWPWQYFAAGLLSDCLWVVAGMLLRQWTQREFFTGAGGSQSTSSAKKDPPINSSANWIWLWIFSICGYATLGLLMILSMISVSVVMTDASTKYGLWSGDFYLLMLLAFLSGALWGSRGLQLTFGVSALLSLGMVLAWSYELTLLDIRYNFFAIEFPYGPEKSMALRLFAVLLYARMGIKLAAWLRQQPFRIPAPRREEPMR